MSIPEPALRQSLCTLKLSGILQILDGRRPAALQRDPGESQAPGSPGKDGPWSRPTSLASRCGEANSTPVTSIQSRPRASSGGADLLALPPEPGCFDLVSVQLMQLPPEPCTRLFTVLAAAVRAGGMLLVVGHHPSDLAAGVPRWPMPELFYTCGEIAVLLDDSWTIEVSQARPRPASTLRRCRGHDLRRGPGSHPANSHQRGIVTSGSHPRTRGWLPVTSSAPGSGSRPPIARLSPPSSQTSSRRRRLR